ncbi:hypothetical protein EEY24_22365 [Shewanella algae]|nr:hypothetical protein EEY24_22365 [Shewanella algae]
MKDMSRALRRHHQQRLQCVRKRYWGSVAGNSVKALGICVTTPCPCSCYLCGHQRKICGPKASEIRQKAKYS